MTAGHLESRMPTLIRNTAVKGNIMKILDFTTETKTIRVDGAEYISCFILKDKEIVMEGIAFHSKEISKVFMELISRLKKNKPEDEIFCII